MRGRERVILSRTEGWKKGCVMSYDEHYAVTWQAMRYHAYEGRMMPCFALMMRKMSIVEEISQLRLGILMILQ